MDEATRQAYRKYHTEGTKDAYAAYLRTAIRGGQPAHCYFCKNLVDPDSLLVCDYEPGCQAAACQDCSVNSLVCADADCDARGCPDCADACPTCDKKICPGDHNTTCSECYTETCLECNAYCNDCGESFCRNHMDFLSFICNTCDEHGENDDDDYPNYPEYSLPGGDGYRRNPDADIRQLERDLAASGAQEIANRLMLAYQRAGRELDYLLLLDQYGTPLQQHGRYVMGDSGYQRLYYPKLDPEQEQRLQHLMWTSLAESAVESDKTGLIDIPLLRVAETFIDRNVHSRWAYNIYLDVEGETSPNEDKEKSRPRYGSEARPGWNDDASYLEKAKIYCTYDDEGVDLFDKAGYLEYWKEYPNHLIDEPWDNTKGCVWPSDEIVPWDGSLENLGYVGGGNLTGIGFMYHHRNCAHDPRDDMDPNDPMNQPPPDTPSLPPMGTHDPNW